MFPQNSIHTVVHRVKLLKTLNQQLQLIHLKLDPKFASRWVLLIRHALRLAQVLKLALCRRLQEPNTVTPVCLNWTRKRESWLELAVKCELELQRCLMYSDAHLTTSPLHFGHGLKFLSLTLGRQNWRWFTSNGRCGWTEGKLSRVVHKVFTCR